MAEIEHEQSVTNINNIFEEWSKIKNKLLEDKNASEVLFSLYNHFSRQAHDGSSRAKSLAHELFEELYRITKHFSTQQDGGTSLFNFLGSRTGVYLISLLEHLSHEPDVKIKRDWLVEFTKAINSLLALPSIYASSAESNPSRSQLNKAKEELQQLPQQFATYTVQSLDKLYADQLSPLPQNFAFVADTLTVKSSALNTSNANIFADDNSIQLVGCLCYHLLSIIFNLCAVSARTADELISAEDVVDNLIAILLVKPQLVDFGLFFVQQQMTRTLARAILSLCQDFNKYSQAFYKGGVLTKLLSNLRNATQLPSVICVELVQVIVYTIKIVSPSSDKLLNEFVKSDGYSTFADNLLVVGNSTTKELQERYIAILCHLLFVGKKSSESLVDILARNISALNIFLCVFTETKSDRLKVVLVRVIFETITLIAERYDLCKDLEPFQAAFMQFDQLAAVEQKLVLATMITVLSKSSLFPPELRAFVQLLSSKKVGTPTMVLDNLTTLLVQKKLRRSELNQAGLLDALIEFIGATSVDAELLRKALKVLRLMLNGHSQNQLYFAMRGGVTKLQNYLSDNNFRRDMLHVIAIIALGEVTSQSKIVFDLIQVLQSSGGTAAIDTETINKRKDILSVLSYVFANNASIRESFRIGGGFVWIISVLGGLGRSIDEVTNRDEVYSFVVLLIEVLVNTMRGNTINQAYMRDEIGYQTILDALMALRIAEQGQYQVPLISALLSLSVSGGWPGNCGGHKSSFEDDSDDLSIVHLHHWARDFATLKSFVKNSLVTTKDRSNLCSKCKDELTIDTPELLEMTFNLLIKRGTEKNETDEGDGAVISREVLQLDDNFNDIDLIEASNLGLYLIVQALRLLTNLHLSNRVILAKHSFVGFFLNNFKSTLVSHPNTREKARFQYMLLELLKDAAQFHITPEELKRCFCLLREDPPVLFLDALHQIFKRGNAPSHISHFPRRKNVLVKSPLIEEKNWPPVQGFSVSLWFQVINQGDTFGDRKPVTLITLDSKTKAGKFEVIFYKGLITVRSAANQSITFTDFMFKEDRWYHLSLIHTSKEHIKLYVDGILYKQTTLSYPSPHHITFSCVFGTPTEPNNTPTVSWSLGNFFLFDMPLDDVEVFLCYCLGPNYVGTLLQTQMGWFQVFDIINARNLTMHKNRLQLVTHLNKYNVNSIREKVVLMYSAKNMVFAGPDMKVRSFKVMTPQRLPLSPVVRSSQALELNSFVEYSPVIIGDVLRIVQMSAKECLQSIGGVSLIIYLFGVCKTKEHQLAALRLLKTSLEWNATNVREMSSMGGYEIISKLIRKLYSVPDEDLLEVLFSFCGLRRSSRDETFSSGVIQDLNALHNFILDWNLWKKSSVQVQALLFLSLSRCVLTHELAAIHAHRLRNADVVPTVLRILEEDQLAGVPARYAVELLGPLAPPSPFDSTASNDQSLVPLNQLFAFLLASHSAETSQAPLSCPLDAIHRSPTPITRVTGTTPPTLKSLRNAEGVEETPSEQIREKRDLVLNLLLETLKKCPSEVVVPFFEQTMTIEVMFALMQTRDESTLVLLLRVLEVLLRDPKNVARFKRTYGFDLLGYHLRSYAVSTDVFGVLFGIAIGKSDTFTGFNVSSVQSFLHFTNQKQGQEQLKLEHPEALSSIMIAATSCLIASDVQHSVIKVIHDLFLQNDAIKGQMINGGIIELLCHLLVSTFEHKQALYSKGLTNEELDSHWEIEIDVLGLLNAIALYGFMSSFGQVLTEEILVALHVLPFPYDYSVALQRRVLYDVLEFFNKSQSPDQKLATQIEKLLELSVTSMLFLSTKTAQQEKLRRSKAYRYKPRTPAASPLRSSDMSLTQSVDRSLSLSDPTKYMRRESSLKLLPTTPTSKKRDAPTNLTNNDAVRKSESGDFSLNKTLPADFSESEDEDSMSELVQASKYLNIPVTIATSKTPTPSPRPSPRPSRRATPRREENNTNADESLQEQLKRPLPSEAGFVTPPNEPSDSGYMSAPMTPRTAAKAQSELEEFIEATKILTKESEFVRVMFNMFMTNLKKKKSGSLLRKLYSKAISSSDRDLSWFFERFIIHCLTTYKNPQTLKTTLELIPQINIEIFNSDRDTYCRILLYSSPLLSRDGVQLECWEMWKLLAKTKIVSELLMFPEDTPIDTLGPGDEGELILMTEVVNTVGKLEKRDASMVKEVTQVLIDFVNKARSVVRSRADFLRQISSTFSNKFITAQHALTKPLMDFIKELMERSKKTRQQWKKLLKRVRPDRSPWAVHPSLIRWEVDPTEGPMRMRLRLRKVWANHHPILGATYTGDGVVSGPSSANLSSGDLEDAPKIDPTNLYIDYDIPQQLIDDMNWVEGLCDDNEDFEMDSNFLEHELQPGDQIISTYKCASITPFHKRDGEILIGSFNAYFIDSHRFQTTAERRRKITSVRKHLIFPYDEIEAIHKRRYLLKNSALEIFLINGRTYLMAFEKESERDSIYDSLTKMEMVNFVDYENSAETLKADLTKRWQRGRVTNFEYLMHLNTLAGRSFNDLTQYPVFPFILSKYKKSRQLNVSDPSNYRNLSKPMGAQTEERLQKFVEKYNALIEMGEPPFLYGSHYSNIGTVLHFLVRLEPFSRYFVEFQGGKFDVPDRVFHSLDTTWDLSSAMSTSDVKELVPEFFYMPEFLVNDNGFKLGTKQDGQVVNNVILPYWAKGDAREFIERHREAMESRYVSENLHNWIDLMFGYKQTGEAALKAMNLFHPLTYEGAVDIDKIADPVMRAATITQISNYGQAPKQIFKRPHPSRGLVPTPIDTVYANYERLSPHPLYSLSGQVGYVEYVRGSPVALGINKCNLWPYGDLCLQWGNWDGSLRITSLKDKGRVVDQIESFEMFNDTIAAVDVSRNGWLIAAGFESSVVRLWRNRPYSMKYRQLRGEDVSQLKGNRLKSDNIALIAELNGHDGAVTCIKVSSDWSLVLSGSRDGTVIVWDSNHARYIRELRPLHSEEPVVVPNKEAPMSIDELSLINTLSAHDSSAENSSAEVSTEASPRARNLRKRPTGPPEPDLVNLGITAVNIHPFTGEIITVLETTKGSLIDMWSINGDRLASLLCSDQVLCVTFTTCKPGLGVNLLITGHMSGDVKLWSMRDLTLVKSLTRNATPVTAIGVSPDDRQIVTGDSSGMLVVYLAKPLDRPQLGLEVGL